MKATYTPSTVHLNRFWIKAAFLSLLLFIIGTLISRSLANFSKYLCIIISIKFFLVILRHSSESTLIKPSKKYFLHYFTSALFAISIGIAFTLLGWTLRYFEGELFFLILLGMIWPLLIWFTGWRKGVFNDNETLHWWFFNGLLWWFTITFIFRDIGIINGSNDIVNISIARHQVKGVLTFALSFTLPLTLFYFFLKTIISFNLYPINKHTEFYQMIKILGIAAIVSLGTLTIMGLPSLFSLSFYWPKWEAISQSLAISNNNGRLSSFHFVLDLSNILIQGLFITLSWILGHYFLKSKPSTSTKKIPLEAIIALGFCVFLLVMFIFTWTKLLIPLAFTLLTLFLIIIFKKHLLYIIGVTALLSGLFLVITLTTDNQLNKFRQDINKVVKVIQNHLQSSHRSLNNSLVDALIEADLIYSPSFIYRLQHHIWGWNIMMSAPLTGIGPYGYTDYVIAHYLQDMPKLPAILLSHPNITDLETKKKLLADKKNINRSLLGTHSDWVMIVSSGGIPGMFFYYGLFVVWISYFISTYRRENNVIYLGLAFALFAMLASGITEPNFKGVHFHLLSLYALVFMGSKFLNLKKENAT